MVLVHLDPNTEVHRTYPNWGYVGVGGVLPHQITRMSPLSNMAEMDEITGRLSWLDQWPVLPVKVMKLNPITHVDMGCGCALYGCYPKVITRSSEDHRKVKSAQIG